MPEVNVLPPINGYCNPITERLEDIWRRSILINSNTGTLDALLSEVNTRGRRMLNVYDDRGKRLYTRLQFQRRNECPDDITVQLGANCDFTVCNEAGNTTDNRWDEYVINPDDLLCLQLGDNSPYQFSITYDFAEGEKICPEDEASEIAARMSEWMDNYAIKLNSILYGMLSQDWANYPSAGGPCDTSVLGGYGKGGWYDLNKNLNTDKFTINAVDQSGAVLPFFVNDFRKLLMLNGFDEQPIAVHGMGGLYDYATFQQNAARAYCCNDAGVNPNELAGQMGFYNFMEGRPTANTNAGVTQDDVLLWNPGAHQLIQPIDFKEPGQQINQYDHERRIIPHRSGLVFHLIRNLDKCGAKLQQNYTLYHRFKLYSKPVDVDDCNTGINQTICALINRCTPLDCDGNPTWGDIGDPTVPNP